MKRVLLLAYLFPPIANSGTQRPLKFAKYLGQHGWAPTVVTAAQFENHRTDPGLLADIPAGVQVVRVPMLNQRVGAALAKSLGGTAIGQRLGNGVEWRMQNRYRTPDLYGLWRPTAVRASMRIFRDVGFDAIYATGYPWTSLLVGRDVSKATGCPLVADFRDLWAGETSFLSERPDRAEELALERAVVDTAQSVVSTSSAMTRLMIAAHPEADAGKFVTIHNGFDPEDLDVTQPPRQPDQPFRIVFTGVWKEGYNPSALYDSIDWLRRSQPKLLDGVEVVAAGFEPGEAKRRGLLSHITEVGVLPHRDAVALMHSADVLYLTHADSSRQWAVPGKLYEYLASGRPVMALTNPDGETGQIIGQVGGGLAIAADDPGALYQAIADACRLRKLETPPLDRHALAGFERRHLARRLTNVLNDVTSRVAAPGVVSRMSPAAPVVPRWRPR